MTERPPRILLVDDDAAFGQVMKAGLEQHGFDVRYEARSVNTTGACLEFRPDLVLLDIDMPVRDGGQVAAGLRAHPTLRHIPVVFLSSLVERAETGRRNASQEIFLSKQIRIADLVAILRDVLRRQSPNGE
jgi:CheY-like chemotaxis protein